MVLLNHKIILKAVFYMLFYILFDISHTLEVAISHESSHGRIKYLLNLEKEYFFTYHFQIFEP